MTEPIKGIKVQNAYLGNFQDIDKNGSNFTTLGVNFGSDKLKGFSVYTGVGTNFRENTTGAVIDFKGYWPYKEVLFPNNQNMTISAGGRLRNKFNRYSQTFQPRLEPAKTKLPLNDNVSLCLSPYIQTKFDYNNIITKNLQNNIDYGVMLGVTVNCGSVNVNPEIQFDSNKKASANVILSYNF